MNQNGSVPNNVPFLSPEELATNCNSCGSMMEVIQTIFTVCPHCFTEPDNKTTPVIHTRISYGGASVRQTSPFDPLPMNCELVLDSKIVNKNTITLHYSVHRKIDNLNDTIPIVSTAAHACHPQQSSQSSSSPSSPGQSDAKGNGTESTKSSTPSDNPEAELTALEHQRDVLQSEVVAMEARLALERTHLESAMNRMAFLRHQIETESEQHSLPPAVSDQEPSQPAPDQAGDENAPRFHDPIPPPVRLVPVWQHQPLPDQMGPGMPYQPPAGSTQYYDQNAYSQQFPPQFPGPISFLHFPPFPGAQPYGYFVAPPNDPFIPPPPPFAQTSIPQIASQNIPQNDRRRADR